MIQYFDILILVQAVFAAYLLIAAIKFLKLRAWARTVLEVVCWLGLAYMVGFTGFWISGWIAMTQIGHLYLCTGDPSSGGNWSKQSTGDHDTSPVNGIAVFTSAACVDGVSVACGRWVDAANKRGFVLITEDSWVSFIAEPGWTHVQKAGAWLAYFEDYNNEGGFVCLYQFDQLPYGDLT